MNNNQELIQNNIEEYLLKCEDEEMLRFISCGSVDDGKSTLLGRLLYDSRQLCEDQIASITHESIKSGSAEGGIDYAYFLDGLQSEREQGITIDVAYRYFSTDKRKFIVADTPGHVQYTRNMVTGASTAELAIILIDSRHGVLEQTRRHSYISRLLGIKHFIVAINKMDLVDFSERVYKKISQDYFEFAKGIGIDDVYFVPISALLGDNVVVQSENTPWYQGNTLLYLLEHVNILADYNTNDFRFYVQYVNRPHQNFRGYSGTISSGSIASGDELVVLPSGIHTRARTIVSYDEELSEAHFSEAVTLCLSDNIDIGRGDVLVSPTNLPEVSQYFSAHLVWMSRKDLDMSSSYVLKIGTKSVNAHVQHIHSILDINTLQNTESHNLSLNEIAKVGIFTETVIVFDSYEENRETGRFILIDRFSNNTVAAGMIISSEEVANKIKTKGLLEKFLYNFVKKRYPHWGLE